MTCFSKSVKKVVLLLRNPKPFAPESTNLGKKDDVKDRPIAALILFDRHNSCDQVKVLSRTDQAVRCTARIDRIPHVLLIVVSWETIPKQKSEQSLTVGNRIEGISVEHWAYIGIFAAKPCLLVLRLDKVDQSNGLLNNGIFL
jgi:hypothetical protein